MRFASLRATLPWDRDEGRVAIPLLPACSHTRTRENIKPNERSEWGFCYEATPARDERNFQIPMFRSLVRKVSVMPFP